MPDHIKPSRKNGRPFHHSILFKLFVVLFCAVILTYLAFGGFYRSEWNESDRVESHPSLIYYWSLLADKLGSPPDTVLAANLSRDIGVAIGITGSGLDWRSKNFSDYIWTQATDSIAEKSVQMYTHSGRVWAVIPKNGYEYFFGTRRRSPLEGLTTDSISLISVTILVWFLSWMILRRMFRPLAKLEKGVESVESGDLEVKIPEGGRDEFSRLAHSFNNMTRSLRDRIRARDQLLLDVSHELRSPLTRMRLSLEIEDSERAFEKIRKEIGILEKMATEVLETERLQSPMGGLKLETTSLQQLVREKIALFQELGFSISFEAKNIPTVKLDSERIRMVLQNVFENAMKYGYNMSRPVKVFLYQEKTFVVLEIHDFGVGISEKDLPFIFEPFYRVDRSRSRVRGYGLGLGLCKRIIELHGGTLYIESKVGEGTKVIVKLPLG